MIFFYYINFNYVIVSDLLLIISLIQTIQPPLRLCVFLALLCVVVCGRMLLCVLLIKPFGFLSMADALCLTLHRVVFVYLSIVLHSALWTTSLSCLRYALCPCVVLLLGDSLGPLHEELPRRNQRRKFKY